MNFTIDWQKLTSVNRLFEINPDPVGLYLYLAIFFGLSILAAIILKIFLKKKKTVYLKSQKSLSNLLLFLGLTGGAIIFMRWQAIPYIGSRFALLVSAVISFFWLVNILLEVFVLIPKKEKQKIVKQSFEKYLPKKRLSRKKYTNV